MAADDVISIGGEVMEHLYIPTGITLGAGKEVDEVAEGASGMNVDRIGEVADRASEGQAAGVYGSGFTAGSLARNGVRSGMRETVNKVSSDSVCLCVPFL